MLSVNRAPGIVAISELGLKALVGLLEASFICSTLSPFIDENPQILL